MFNKYIEKCNFLFCKDDLLTFTVLWFVHSNILTLMNTFDLPEGNITESNYDSILQHLNSTAPAVFQELQLKTCDIQTFLSQVCVSSFIRCFTSLRP